MKARVQDERRRAFRVDPDAWCDPEFDWSYEDLLDVAIETASSDSPNALIPTVVRRLLPEGQVRSWAVITIDDNGGLHRDCEASADPGLHARAVAWLWTATGDPCAAEDGAAYVEAWSSELGAEAVACMPLVRDGIVRSLIAIWLTADDMDAVIRDVSRLTLIRRVWAGAHVRDGVSDSRDGSPGDAVPQTLTVRQTVILQAMAEGLTNAQIARHINFSESTVRLESMHIYRHFGVHSRSDAVRRAQEVGAL